MFWGVWRSDGGVGLIEILARNSVDSGRSSRLDSYIFWVLGLLGGLGGCRQRGGLVWLGLLERYGCSVIFGWYSPVLGRGSH